MNDRIDGNARLMDYVLGELDADEKAQLEAEMDQDPQLRREADRLRVAVEAIDGTAGAVPSAGFDANLWRQIDAEATAGRADTRPRSRGRRFLFRWTPVGIAAAAVVAVILMWQSGSPQGGATSVAWGEVVQAMNRVDHFHATTVIEDPEDRDPERRMYKIDLYYRRPDLWRAQGLNYVQFMAGDTVKAYDVTRREFVDPSRMRVRLMRPRFVAAFEEGDLLGAVLASFFRGDPPRGEPVRSSDIAASGGIEIFDYARDAKRRWIRIWVLKESRLPLRMKVFEPERNELMLVTFDYSDRQPAGYFDSDHFARTVMAEGLTRPHQILRAGAVPLDGKPTNRGHAFELQGEFKAAEILESKGDAAGGILIVHTDPRNLEPEVGSLREHAYERPTDNWGNVYLMTFGLLPLGGNWTTGYLPIAPFRRGRGERVVSFQYAIELEVPSKGTSDSPETIYKVLSTEDLTIGLDDAEDVSAEVRQECWGPEAQREMRKRHLETSYSALEKWRYIQTQLDTRGQDVAFLIWAYRLLWDHGRVEQARQLMADRLLPAFCGALLDDQYWSSREVSEYLQWLFQTRGIEAVRPTAILFRQVREQAANNRNRKAVADYHFEGRRLGWVLQLSNAVEDFEQWPSHPQVQAIVRGPDKCVIVTVGLPPDPTGNACDPMRLWGPWPGADAPEALVHYDPKAGTYSWLLESPDDPLVLEFRPLILRTETGGIDIRTTWSLPVDLARARTVASTQQWWDEHIKQGEVADTSRFSQLTKRASAALKGQQWTEAIELYTEVLALPKDQWPQHMFHEANGHLDAYETSRRRYAYEILKARLRMGELEAVAGEIDKLQAELPPLDEFSEDFATMLKAIQQHSEVRSVRLAAVAYLLDEGRSQDASAMLSEIATGRPDPFRFPKRQIWIDQGRGASSVWPRYALVKSWWEFDTVQWDMMEPRRGSRAD